VIVVDAYFFLLTHCRHERRVIGSDADLGLKRFRVLDVRRDAIVGFCKGERRV
jgi:hypothetical protein